MPYWIELLVPALAFIITAVSGHFLIPVLKKVGMKQTIYELAPDSHKKKQGTPMMGGFMFIIGSLSALAIGIVFYYKFSENAVLRLDNVPFYRLIVGIIFILLNASIGFTDDYIKAVKHQNAGLNPKQKMILQFFYGAAFLYALYILGDTSTAVIFPFLGELNLGLFYYPIMLLVIVYLTNAVNLTDGVDGLCGSITVITGVALAMCSAALGAQEYTLFSLAIAGACLGFLVHNLHPAAVMMGDTGSMYLGGFVVAVGFVLHQHIILFVVALVYIIEALSVVLQVIYFKITKGKRIFKMSPIHHHYELSGWSENKIVVVFSTLALVCAVAGYLLLTFGE
jgi:phospho-N-acetylmuramoyl-pentapeptide-transferase